MKKHKILLSSSVILTGMMGLASVASADEVKPATPEVKEEVIAPKEAEATTTTEVKVLVHETTAAEEPVIPAVTTGTPTEAPAPVTPAPATEAPVTPVTPAIETPAPATETPVIPAVPDTTSTGGNTGASEEPVIPSEDNKPSEEKPEKPTEQPSTTVSEEKPEKPADTTVNEEPKPELPSTKPSDNSVVVNGSEKPAEPKEEAPLQTETKDSETKTAKKEAKEGELKELPNTGTTSSASMPIIGGFLALVGSYLGFGKKKQEN